MKLPIYLDYAATTPMDERVAKKMMEYMTKDGIFGNPALAHTNLVGKRKKRLMWLVTKLPI